MAGTSKKKAATNPPEPRHLRGKLSHTTIGGKRNNASDSGGHQKTKKRFMIQSKKCIWRWTKGSGAHDSNQLKKKKKRGPELYYFEKKCKRGDHCLEAGVKKKNSGSNKGEKYGTPNPEELLWVKVVGWDLGIGPSEVELGKIHWVGRTKEKTEWHKSKSAHWGYCSVTCV